MKTVLGIVFITTLILMPTGIAMVRRHRKILAIFLTQTIGAGVAGIGWFLGLIWAFSDNTEMCQE